MSKETDQKFAAGVKKGLKRWKVWQVKLGALLCVASAIITLASLIPKPAALIAAIPAVGAFKLWYEATKLVGPNLGKAPGRARKATHDDLKKAGLV